MVGVFVAFIRVVYGRMIYMSLPGCNPTISIMNMNTEKRNYICAISK